MSCSLTNILNWKNKLKSEDVFIGDGIKEAVIYEKGDYNLSLYELVPNHPGQEHTLLKPFNISENE